MQQRRCSNIAVISQIRHAALSHEAFSSGTIVSFPTRRVAWGAYCFIYLPHHSLYCLLQSPRLIPLKQAAAEAARQLERQLGRSSCPKPWRRSCWLIWLLTGRGYPAPPPLTLLKWLAIFYPPPPPIKKTPQHVNPLMCNICVFWWAFYRPSQNITRGCLACFCLTSVW